MTQPTEAPAASRNRLPVILGAGLAAVVLIFVLTQLVGGGDDVDESTTPTTTSGVRATTTTTTAPSTGQPVETFEVFTSKNPFQPLRVVGGGATTGGTSAGGTSTGGTSGGTSSGGTSGGTSSGGTSGGTSTGGTSGGTSSGGTSGGTSTGGSSGGTSTGGTSGGSTSPRRSDRVTLVDVFVERGRVVANVRVNDTVHKVGVGDTFATSYKVLSLSQADECGRFTFGDDSFRLCRGEQTLK